MAESASGNSGSPAHDRSPSFANAYAITYRLLGVRAMATDVAAVAGVAYASRESEPAQQWLPDLALEAVNGSLEAADGGTGNLSDATEVSTRAALRRRLGAADARTRVAVGLHQLGGYGIEDTAALMAADPSEVLELCGGFDPAPGRRWADLGDPLARGASNVSRHRESRRRIPAFPVVLVVLLAVVAIWAATSIGQRPSLGNADGESATGDGSGSGVVFSPTVDPLPGAGCAGPAAAALQGGISTQELDIDGAGVSYRLSVPPGTAPAPVVVSLSDVGQDAAVFQGDTKLEESLPGALHVTLETSEGDAVKTGGVVVPAALDELITSHCVDLARVTVVGFGTGGAAAAVAACESPELVSGFAMVSGLSTAEGCDPSPAVAVLAAARDDDPAVQTGTALQELGDSWAELLGADTESVEGRDQNTLVRTWVGPGDVEVRTVSKVEGGHDWLAADTDEVVGFIARTARRTA